MIRILSLTALLLSHAQTHANEAFERRAKRGVSVKFATEVLRMTFNDEADRAYLTKVAPGANTVVKLRDVSVKNGLYTLTAPNGRSFTVTAGPTATSVKVNDRVISWRNASLEQYLNRFESALHKTFVTHLPWPMELLAPRTAEATAVPVLVLGGLMIYFGWETWQRGSYADRVLLHFTTQAKTCAVENSDSTLEYASSETEKSLVELAKLKIEAPEVVPDGQGCAYRIERALMTEEGRTPRLTLPERKAACAEIERLTDCARTFRNREVGPVQEATLIDRNAPAAH